MLETNFPINFVSILWSSFSNIFILRMGFEGTKAIGGPHWDKQRINESNSNNNNNNDHNNDTLKPVYLEHVDKWFLKIYSLKQYRTNFKNQLSACST